tara:strand:- start:3682 stop:4731 length:1050 start_codon:yes stop_codon:yes gene_type:complete
MKVLVTGGSGYFGSLLIERLIRKKYHVESLDINRPDIESDIKKFHQIDIRDRESLDKCLEGYDIIFHNVAQVPLAKDKNLFTSVNVDGTENICRAAVKNGIKKLIYTSSSAVYGIPQYNPVTENSIPNPGEEYGLAKLIGEEICKSYNNKGLNVSIIRPRTIIGHGRLGIFYLLFNWIREGINIPVLNDGGNMYQFVHAEDLADACILASEHKKSFSTYNIGSDDCQSMRTTLEQLCEYAETGSKIYSLPRKPIEIIMNITSKLRLTPLAPYHAMMYGRSLYFNIDKAKKELGFNPKYSTREMFRESYNWFKKNYDKDDKINKVSIHKGPVKESMLKILRWISKMNSKY